MKTQDSMGEMSLFASSLRGLLMEALATGLAVTLLTSAAPFPARAQDLEDAIDDEIDASFESEAADGMDEIPLDDEALLENGDTPDSAATADEPAFATPLEPAESSLEPEPLADPPVEAADDSVVLSGLTSTTDASDSPNQRFEQRIFQIFQNASPIADDEWQRLLGERRAEGYAIQAGDTLWDISATFFGDGMYWPKLWSENHGIENPHDIKVGRAIRFVSGTEAEAPSFEVTKDLGFIAVNSLREITGPAPVYREELEETVSPEELANNSVLEAAEIIPRPEIPPPPPSRPVLKQLPASFKTGVVPNQDAYDSSGVDPGRRPALTEAADVVINYYLSGSDPEGIGSVEEIEAGEKMAAIGQTVLVRLDRPGRPGERLTVVKSRGKIKDADGREWGPVVEVSGRLVLGEASGAENGLFRATVTMARSPIEVGSLLTADDLATANFNADGPRSDVAARVVGGEFDTKRRLLGENAVIYLDKGAKAGLRVGDLLAVRSTRSFDQEKPKFSDIERPIGLIKVVKVENEVATALVIRAMDVIRPGDTTGGAFPSLTLPDLITE